MPCGKGEYTYSVISSGLYSELQAFNEGNLFFRWNGSFFEGLVLFAFTARCKRKKTEIFSHIKCFCKMSQLTLV